MVWDFEDIGDWWICVDVDVIVFIVVVFIIVGIGFEVGCVSVIINVEIVEKKIIFYFKVLFLVVICDLELIVGMLFVIMVGIGFDVFVYCVEVFSSLYYYFML